MNKKTSRKLLVLLMALTLLIGCALGGTAAWLITKSDTVTNTFTKGNITLSLSEPSWQTNFINSEGVGTYKAIPGDLIPKDPTVTVGANSVDCYVRMFMVIWWEPITDGYFTATDSDAWFKAYAGGDQYVSGHFMQDANCVRLYDKTNDYVLGIVQEFRYSDKIETSESAQVLRPPFGAIQVPTDLGQEQFASLDNFKLIMLAQAVQADGFASAEAAFEAAGIPDVTLDDCRNAANQPQTLETIIDVLKKQDTLYPST